MQDLLEVAAGAPSGVRLLLPSGHAVARANSCVEEAAALTGVPGTGHRNAASARTLDLFERANGFVVAGDGAPGDFLVLLNSGPARRVDGVGRALADEEKRHACAQHKKRSEAVQHRHTPR